MDAITTSANAAAAYLSRLSAPPTKPTSTVYPPNGGSKAHCAKCGDIGLLGWKTPQHYPLSECQFCDCPIGVKRRAAAEIAAGKVRQAKLDEQFAAAGIPAHFANLTLETLRQVAGDDAGKQAVLAAIQSLLDTGRVAGKLGLFVYGDFGTGKTGALTPVLRSYLDHGLTCLWLEFYDFVDEIQSRYGRSDGGSADDALDNARRCDCLLLDDVGDAKRNDRVTGFAETSDRQRLLYQVVNHRHNHMRPMLFTSNLNPGQFAQQFGARTFERIAESCAIIQMNGRNLRRSA